MCQQCEDAGPKTISSGSKRLKLWQMPQYMHCPIIGTCLTMAELRKVQRQSGLELPPGHSDYHLHTCLVGLAKQNSPASRRINKLLDAKYGRWIKAYGKLTSAQEREQFWREALRTGEISGPFWALLSHRSSGPALSECALGDIHMLSHLQGASNRADLRRTASLEQEVADLQQKLAQLQEHYQQKQQQNDQLLEAQNKALQALRRQLQPSQGTDEHLREQLEESRKQYRLMAKRQDWALKQLAQRELRLTELQQRQERLLEQLKESRQERDTVEETLDALLIQHSREQAGPGAVIDLKGRRLAYIGGRTSLYPRLKAFVEAHNGRLLHHDGGLEDNRAELCNCLSGADLVFCPVDCISHDACLRVKRFCKRHEKPFVPLRSASLSAFTSRLIAVSEPPHIGTQDSQPTVIA